MEKEAVRVLVTDAGGPVAGRLCFYAAGGTMLGPHQRLIFHLLHRGTASDEVAVKDLQVAMLCNDSHVLGGGMSVETSNVEEACKGVQIAILMGKLPKKKSGTMLNSFGNCKLLAEALEKHAAANCKVLIISYPADLIALTLRKFAPSIASKNITCLTRVYHNCAMGFISDQLDVANWDMKNIIIWGNHSPPIHLDVNHATVNKHTGVYPVRELLNEEFMTRFQVWAKFVIETPEDDSAANIVVAAINHIHDWVLGTPEFPRIWVSMGLLSDGSYNVPAGLIYSFPVTCRNGEWTIVQGLALDEPTRKKMDLAVEELMKQQLLTFASIERQSHEQKPSPSS